MYYTYIRRRQDRFDSHNLSGSAVEAVEMFDRHKTSRCSLNRP